eukprot:1481237-Rhodomonas_salina.2
MSDPEHDHSTAVRCGSYEISIRAPHAKEHERVNLKFHFQFRSWPEAAAGTTLRHFNVTLRHDSSPGLLRAGAFYFGLSRREGSGRGAACSRLLGGGWG